MRTVRDAPGRPDRGLFGVVPPGRPTDVAVAVLVGVVQLGLTTLAARRQTDRHSLDLLAYLLLAVGPVALLWRWRSPPDAPFCSGSAGAPRWGCWPW